MARLHRRALRQLSLVRSHPALMCLEDRLAPAVHVWTGGPLGTGDQWLSAGNWIIAGTSPPVHAVPGPNDDAAIPAGGATLIVLDASTSVRSVNSARNVRIASGTLSVAGVPSTVGDTLTQMILDGGNFDPADGATIGGQMTGPTPFTIPAGRTINIQQLTVNNPLVNNGTIIARATNRFAGGITTSAASTIRIQGDATIGDAALQVPNGFINNGTFQLTSNSAVNRADLSLGGGVVTNAAGATFDVAVGAGGERRVAMSNSGLLNQGTFTVASNLFMPVQGVSRFATSGTLTVNPGVALAIDGVGGASSFDYQGGPVSGGGSVTLQALVVNVAAGQTLTNGPVAISTMPGTFTVNVNGPGALANAVGATFNLTNAVVDAPFTNAGTLVARGNVTVNAGLATTAGSVTRVLGDTAVGAALLTVGGGGMTNAGTLELTSTGTGTGPVNAAIGGNGYLTNAVGGTLRAAAGTGGTRVFGGNGMTLVNRGTLDASTTFNIDVFGTRVITSGPIAVSPGATLTIASTIGGVTYQGGTLSGGGTLILGGGTTTIASGATLTNGPVTVALTGTINGPGTVVNPLGSTLNISSATIAAPLTNAGTMVFRGNNTLTGGMLTVAGSTTRVLADGAAGNLTVNGGGVTNNGTFELTSTGVANAVSLSANATFLNAAGGTFNVLAGTGGARTLSVDLSPNAFLNAGAFNLTGTNLTVTSTIGLGIFSNSGTLTVGAGTTLSSNTPLANTGTLAGAGVYAGNVSGSGTVSPGLSGPGLLTLNGNVSLGGGLIAQLNGVTAGTQYDQLQVNGTVTLSGPLALSVGFTAAVDQQFTLIGNDGTDAVTGNFLGLPQGATMSANGQAFSINYAGGTDNNDVVLTRLAGAAPQPPKPPKSQVNDGGAQRSRITSLTVAFDGLVAFASSPSASFTLMRGSDGAIVTFDATVSVKNSQSVVTLSNFSGSATEFGSIADGRYTLRALANRIAVNGLALDGNGDGAGGDDYTFGDAQGLFRLFGDANGDRRVDVADFGFFAAAYLRPAGSQSYVAYFDANADGRIDIADFGQFAKRYQQLFS